MFKKIILLFLFGILLSSCSKENIASMNCDVSDLGITELNGSRYTYDNGQLAAYWKARYSDEYVEVLATNVWGHGERNHHGYVFKKNGNCLEFYYAYGIFDGWYQNRKKVWSINVDDVLIQDWEEDTLFSGKIVETNSSGDIIERKFWVELDSNSEYNFSYGPLTTENCLDMVSPTEIDMNGDGIIDIAIEKEGFPVNFGSNLPKKTNVLKVAPKNNNFLLSNNRIFFEAPFSSLNEQEYQIGSNYYDIIGLLHEYEFPYDRFNFWYADESPGGINYYLPNTLPDWLLNNDIDDYLIVKIEKDGLYYYGWIRMTIDFDNCQFEVLETYLNPVPNQHVSVP